MDTTWIQVFVLMLSECVAPEGKTVCQQHEFELTFLDREDCELALAQLVGLKSRAENVIVDKEASRCAVSARQRAGYPDLAAVSAAHADDPHWQAPTAAEAEAGADQTRQAHEQRLARLPACGDSDERPCKIGDIIIEANATDEVEVWRRQR